MQHETIDKWVRAFVGDTVVVDSRRPMLFWESRFPVPGYCFDPADVRMDLLVPAEGDPPQQPLFNLPKSPVARWYDLLVGGRTLPHAAWTLADESLGEHVVLSWQPGLIDRWMEEDEQVLAHPRDPHKRVEAIASSRRVTVSVDGTELAASSRPVLLFETGLPTRYYLPPEDVELSRLIATEHESVCPYKGIADGYWDLATDPPRSNIAWSYSAPYDAVRKIAGRIAFYNELVDITIDAVPVPQPVSIFSEPSKRP